MSISPHLFRNVVTSPDDPMDEWPHEVIRAAIEYGMLSDWSVIVRELRRNPHGDFAQTVEETLDFMDPSPPVIILDRALRRARGQISEYVPVHKRRSATPPRQAALHVS